MHFSTWRAGGSELGSDLDMNPDPWKYYGYGKMMRILRSGPATLLQRWYSYSGQLLCTRASRGRGIYAISLRHWCYKMCFIYLLSCVYEYWQQVISESSPLTRQPTNVRLQFCVVVSRLFVGNSTTQCRFNLVFNQFNPILEQHQEPDLCQLQLQGYTVYQLCGIFGRPDIRFLWKPDN